MDHSHEVNSKPWRRRWPRVALLAGAVLVSLIIVLVVIPVVSPSTGAAIADDLRSIVGPEPVAVLESLSFRLKDTLKQIGYQANGTTSQVTWSDPSAAPTVEGGWQVFGQMPRNQPVMERTSIKPDSSRPYAEAALVRIDLSQVELHVLPGVSEPEAVAGVPPFPRPGRIPADVQASGKLLAAFNGGFKAVNGHYGMMTDQGVVLQPPLDSIATLAFYRDGRLRLGEWGRDITASADLVAYRQNCPLLLDAGQITPSVIQDNHRDWGTTIQNADATWRSGLGLSRDGHFLIYAAGDSLTVESLARALQLAGADFAMQLDINSLYTRFVTYRPADVKTSKYPVVAQKLLDQMPGLGQSEFLSPYDRDFFYITTRGS